MIDKYYYTSFDGKEPEQSETCLGKHILKGFEVKKSEAFRVPLLEQVFASIPPSADMFDLKVAPGAERSELDDALNYAPGAVDTLRQLLLEQYVKNDFNPIDLADRLNDCAKGAAPHYQDAYIELAGLARGGFIGRGIEPMVYHVELVRPINVVDVNQFQDQQMDPESLRDTLIKSGVDGVSHGETVLLLTDAVFSVSGRDYLVPPSPTYLNELTADPVIVVWDSSESPTEVWGYHALMQDGTLEEISLRGVASNDDERLAIIACHDQSDMETIVRRIDWETIIPSRVGKCYEDHNALVYTGKNIEKIHELTEMMSRPKLNFN